MKSFFRRLVDVARFGATVRHRHEVFSCRRSYERRAANFRPLVEIVYTSAQEWWWHLRDKKTGELLAMQTEFSMVESIAVKFEGWSAADFTHDFIFAPNLGSGNSLGLRKREDGFALIDFAGNESWVVADADVLFFRRQ